MTPKKPLIGFMLVLLLLSASAAVPRLLTVQGRLKESGSAVSGDYDITFYIYNTETGGTPLYTEAHTGANAVPVAAGFFSVVLGEITPLTLPFKEQYWLTLKVGSDSEMSPRIKLTNSSYAFVARDLNVSSNLNIDSGTLYVDIANNRVGVGTTAPTQKLHVYENASSAYAAKIENVNTNGYGLRVSTGGDVVGEPVFYAVGGSGTGFYVGGNNYVGIGTTEPGYKLDVHGGVHLVGNNFYVDYGSYTGSWGRGYIIQNSDASAQYGMFGFYDNDTFQYLKLGAYTSGGSGLFLDSAGNVGIGTTSPGAKLEVNGAIKQNRGQRVNLSGRNTTWLITSYPKAWTGAGSSEMFVINVYDSTYYDASAYETVIIDRAGNLFLGPNGGNQNSSYTLAIKTYDDGTNINVYAVAKTYVDFYTLDFVYNRLNTTINPTNVGDDTYVPSGTLVGETATAPYYVNVGDTTRLTILSNGNVGIGTTGPSSKLTVNGSRIEITGVEQPYLYLHATGSNPGHNWYIMAARPEGLYFYDATDGAPRMVINPTTGNVGIGTTAPGAKLDVKGPIRVSQYYQGWVGAMSPPGSYARLAAMDVANSVNQAVLSENGWVNSNNNALVQDDATLPTWMLVLGAGGAVGYDGLRIKRAPAGSTSANNLATFMAIDNTGNVGIGTTSPTEKLYVVGNIYKTGTVSFVEDYPGKPGKQIVYVSLEGPEAGTYIRGSAECKDNKAVIEFPEHFVLVTDSEGVTAQLTPRGNFSTWIESVNNEKLVVGCSQEGSFDYFVQGIRKGYEDFNAVQDK